MKSFIIASIALLVLSGTLIATLAAEPASPMSADTPTHTPATTKDFNMTTLKTAFNFGFQTGWQ